MSMMLAISAQFFDAATRHTWAGSRVHVFDHHRGRALRWAFEHIHDTCGCRGCVQCHVSIGKTETLPVDIKEHVTPKLLDIWILLWKRRVWASQNSSNSSILPSWSMHSKTGSSSRSSRGVHRAWRGPGPRGRLVHAQQPPARQLTDGLDFPLLAHAKLTESVAVSTETHISGSCRKWRN